MSDRDFELLKAMYDGDIRYTDDQVGNLTNMLRRKGLLDNTLVIFTSDHGEHFGDHHLMSHELSIYDALVRIPIILRYPKSIPGGTRIPEPVQTVDLFPSILQFANVSNAGLDLQGASLLPSSVALPGITRGAASFPVARPEYIFAEYNNQRAVDKIQKRFPGMVSPVWRAKTLRAVRSQDWKLIVGTDGTHELYNVSADPYETTDLAKAEKEKVKALADTLSKWAASFQPSRFYKKEEISKEALDELRALGYVQ